MGAREQTSAARPDQHLSQRLLLSKINRRRPPAKMIMDDCCPCRAGQFVAGLTEQADYWCWQDRRVAGLVVETDVPAGHRRPQHPAAIREPAYRLAELPHDRRILRRAKVEAVSDRQRLSPRGRDISVGLCESQLRTGVRIQQRIAGVAVRGES